MIHVIGTEDKALNKDVIISIQGMQHYEDADDSSVELVTAGTLSGTPGDYTLSYRESELTGLDGTLTTFRVEGEKVTLFRMGEVVSQLVFEEGRRHVSLYSTPYGSLTIGVAARRVLADLSDTGGNIEIDFALEVDESVTGENLFKINVREARRGITQ